MQPQEPNTMQQPAMDGNNNDVLYTSILLYSVNGEMKAHHGELIWKNPDSIMLIDSESRQVVFHVTPSGIKHYATDSVLDGNGTPYLDKVYSSNAQFALQDGRTISVIFGHVAQQDSKLGEMLASAESQNSMVMTTGASDNFWWAQAMSNYGVKIRSGAGAIAIPWQTGVIVAIIVIAVIGAAFALDIRGLSYIQLSLAMGAISLFFTITYIIRKK